MEQQYKTDAEIYAVLEREIIDLTIRPGSSLSENPLCARFGAPRSLIRVVLQKLQENGLVRIVPYKGTTVTRLNRRIVDELIYERTAVEGRILRSGRRSVRGWTPTRRLPAPRTRTSTSCTRWTAACTKHGLPPWTRCTCGAPYRMPTPITAGSVCWTP